MPLGGPVLDIGAPPDIAVQWARQQQQQSSSSNNYQPTPPPDVEIKRHEVEKQLRSQQQQQRQHRQQQSIESPELHKVAYTTRASWARSSSTSHIVHQGHTHHHHIHHIHRHHATHSVHHVTPTVTSGIARSDNVHRHIHTINVEKIRRTLERELEEVAKKSEEKLEKLVKQVSSHFGSIPRIGVGVGKLAGLPGQPFLRGLAGGIPIEYTHRRKTTYSSPVSAYFSAVPETPKTTTNKPQTGTPHTKQAQTQPTVYTGIPHGLTFEGYTNVTPINYTREVSNQIEQKVRQLEQQVNQKLQELEKEISKSPEIAKSIWGSEKLRALYLQKQLLEAAEKFLKMGNIALADKALKIAENITPESVHYLSNIEEQVQPLLKLAKAKEIKLAEVTPYGDIYIAKYGKNKKEYIAVVHPVSTSQVGKGVSPDILQHRLEQEQIKYYQNLAKTIEKIEEKEKAKIASNIYKQYLNELKPYIEQLDKAFYTLGREGRLDLLEKEIEKFNQIAKKIFEEKYQPLLKKYGMEGTPFWVELVREGNYLRLKPGKPKIVKATINAPVMFLQGYSLSQAFTPIVKTLTSFNVTYARNIQQLSTFANTLTQNLDKILQASSPQQLEELRKTIEEYRKAAISLGAYNIANKLEEASNRIENYLRELKKAAKASPWESFRRGLLASVLPTALTIFRGLSTLSEAAEKNPVANIAVRSLFGAISPIFAVVNPEAGIKATTQYLENVAKQLDIQLKGMKYYGTGTEKSWFTAGASLGAVLNLLQGATELAGTQLGILGKTGKEIIELRRELEPGIGPVKAEDIAAIASAIAGPALIKAGVGLTRLGTRLSGVAGDVLRALGRGVKIAGTAIETYLSLAPEAKALEGIMHGAGTLARKIATKVLENAVEIKLPGRLGRILEKAVAGRVIPKTEIEVPVLQIERTTRGSYTVTLKTIRREVPYTEALRTVKAIENAEPSVLVNPEIAEQVKKRGVALVSWNKKLEVIPTEVEIPEKQLVELLKKAGAPEEFIEKVKKLEPGERIEIPRQNIVLAIKRQEVIPGENFLQHLHEKIEVPKAEIPELSKRQIHIQLQVVGKEVPGAKVEIRNITMRAKGYRGTVKQVLINEKQIGVEEHTIYTGESIVRHQVIGTKEHFVKNVETIREIGSPRELLLAVEGKLEELRNIKYYPLPEREEVPPPVRIEVSGNRSWLVIERGPGQPEIRVELSNERFRPSITAVSENELDIRFASGEAKLRVGREGIYLEIGEEKIPVQGIRRIRRGLRETIEVDIGRGQRIEIEIPTLARRGSWKELEKFIENAREAIRRRYVTPRESPELEVKGEEAKTEAKVEEKGKGGVTVVEKQREEARAKVKEEEVKLKVREKGREEVKAREKVEVRGKAGTTTTLVEKEEKVPETATEHAPTAAVTGPVEETVEIDLKKLIRDIEQNKVVEVSIGKARFKIRKLPNGDFALDSEPIAKELTRDQLRSLYRIIAELNYALQRYGITVSTFVDHLGYIHIRLEIQPRQAVAVMENLFKRGVIALPRMLKEKTVTETEIKLKTPKLSEEYEKESPVLGPQEATVNKTGQISLPDLKGVEEAVVEIVGTAIRIVERGKPEKPKMPKLRRPQLPPIPLPWIMNTIHRMFQILTIAGLRQQVLMI